MSTSNKFRKFKNSKDRFENREFTSLPICSLDESLKFDTNVYIIGNLKHGVVKIGKAKDIAKRLSQLQTGCPFELHIICIFPDMGYEFEAALHRRARHNSIQGEWFKVSGKLGDYVIECAARYQNLIVTNEVGKPRQRRERGKKVALKKWEYKG